MNYIKYFIIGIVFIIKSLINFIKYFVIGLITIITIIPYYIIIGIKFIFTKKNPKDTKDIENKFIPITILTLAVTTYLISIFILTRWFVQNERTKNFTNDLINIPVTTLPDEENSNQYEDQTTPEQQTPPQSVEGENNLPQPQQPSKPSNQTATNQSSANTNFINVNLNSYIQKNSETVAWIQLNGTKVNYPVVKHKDNDYYLHHDFNKRKTKNGWIFADYRNNFDNFDNNTIIYGHNIINDKMFGSIPNILYNNKWYSNKNNHYVKLSTKKTNTIWQVFSIYKITPTTDYLQTKFNSTDTYEAFLTTLKNRSTYKFNVELNYTDKIITLSTCDDTGTKRVVIHAKLINIESK